MRGSVLGTVAGQFCEFDVLPSSCSVTSPSRRRQNVDLAFCHNWYDVRQGLHWATNVFRFRATVADLTVTSVLVDRQAKCGGKLHETRLTT